jgi:putative phosphoesterase
MRIALFSDVHGNRHALDAVLADIDAERPDTVYCLGDLVGYGAFPNEVIALIRERGIATVMGNYDEGVGFDREGCGCAYKEEAMRQLGKLSFAWTKAQVSAENKFFLRSLPREIRFEAVGPRLLLVHGSPRKINEYLWQDRPDTSFERIAAASRADIIVCGHTHLPYSKQIGSTLFVNAGSAGKPKDGDTRAAYVLLDIGTMINVEPRRLPYDVHAAAEAIRRSGLPATFADALEAAGG